MKGYAKIYWVSIISIGSAASILLIYVLIIVLNWLFPPPPPLISPFYSAAGPLYFLLLAFALLFLSPVALITGIISLMLLRKGMGNQREKILVLISLIIGGIQTALVVALTIMSAQYC